MTVRVFANIQELLAAIGQRYDVVHLFCDLSPDGNIVDGGGIQTAGATLIQSCCDADVKMLWIASENNPDAYIKGFKAASGKPLNLVLTINRKESAFAHFFENLLLKMSAGEPMPSAWVSLSPQNSNDPRTQNAPSCIFAAGRGGVRLG